jgi:UDP-3-O-[3-hydroxymyristoyl] glucosamine N-acyltransferase
MNEIPIGKILDLIGRHEVVNSTPSIVINSIKPIDAAVAGALSFVAAGRSDALKLAIDSKATVVICEFSLREKVRSITDKCFILVDNPKATFSKVAHALFGAERKCGIHVSAYVHPNASLHATCYVGPNCTLGKCTVGQGSQIHGNVYVGDNTIIGDNVNIYPGAVIGADGFGYYRDEDNQIKNFIHIGGVVIESDVDIGANACVDRGALGNTIIRRGAKIDNLVHIAHNVIVGENAFIIANAMVGGSVKVGEDAWLAPSSTIRDTLTIGPRSMIGLGAVVTKDVPEGEIWAGVPAKRIRHI